MIVYVLRTVADEVEIDLDEALGKSAVFASLVGAKNEAQRICDMVYKSIGQTRVVLVWRNSRMEGYYLETMAEEAGFFRIQQLVVRP